MVNKIHKVIDRIIISKHSILSKVDVIQYYDSNNVFEIKFTCYDEVDCKTQDKIEEDVLTLFISLGYYSIDNDIIILFSNDGIKWYKCYSPK